MIISVFDDFKIFDASSKENVEKLSMSINVTSPTVTLNLCKCIIDYPSTSLIIDKILVQLVDLPGAELIIQTHLNVIEDLLLHWFFIGSSFFGIEDSKNAINSKDLKKIIISKLAATKIKIIIEIVEKNSLKPKKFNYGG